MKNIIMGAVIGMGLMVAGVAGAAVVSSMTVGDSVAVQSATLTRVSDSNGVACYVLTNVFGSGISVSCARYRL